jgi:hypothetical protein
MSYGNYTWILRFACKGLCACRGQRSQVTLSLTKSEDADVVLCRWWFLPKRKSHSKKALLSLISSIDMNTHEVNLLHNKTKSDINSFAVLSNWTNIRVIVAEHVAFQTPQCCWVLETLGVISSDRLNCIRDDNIRWTLKLCITTLIVETYERKEVHQQSGPCVRLGLFNGKDYVPWCRFWRGTVWIS